MIILLALCRDVVETDTRLCHGDTADSLSSNNQQQAQANCVFIAVEILQLGKEEGGDDYFDDGGDVGGEVGGTV